MITQHSGCLVGFAVLSARQSGSFNLRPFGNRTGRKHVSGGRCHGGPPQLTGKALHTGVTACAAMISLGLGSRFAELALDLVPEFRGHLARGRLPSAWADLFTQYLSIRSCVYYQWVSQFYSPNRLETQPNVHADSYAA